MSKELEALKIGIPKLKKLYENNAKKMNSNDLLGFDLTFAYLDKALQRLEAIDNANPSEALDDVLKELTIYKDFVKLFFDIFELKYEEDKYTLTMKPYIENIRLNICLIKDDADKVLKAIELLNSEVDDND